MIHRSLQVRALLSGGDVSENIHFLTQSASTSHVTAAEATVVEYGCGSTMCRNSRMKHRWRSMCLIFQPEHQNGTRSSIVCFAIFLKTGKDSRLLTLKPLLIWLVPQRLKRDYPSSAVLMKTIMNRVKNHWGTEGKSQYWIFRAE